MSVIERNGNSSTGNNSNNEATWWLNLEGEKSDTSVAFNLSNAFARATADQVLKILQTQEVHISCYNKVSIKLRGERENGSKFVFGYLNNYAHGLEVDCEAIDSSAVSHSIKAELENLVVEDLSQLIGEEEASNILDNL